MSRPPCKIDGCDRTSVGRGWCQLHWARWRKNGDPLVALKMGVDYSVKNTNPCSVDGCEKVQLAKGLCTTHYGRVRKHGDPHRVELGGRPWKGGVPTWGAIHRRLKRSRGRAVDHTCVDCNGPAREWSYDNQDPNELVGEANGLMLRYSLDLNHYAPRCTPCHRIFDRKARAA